MDEFNNYYYKDFFEQFASKLKEICDQKYTKYIKVNVVYHTQIKKMNKFWKIQINLF
mgnify:CR=1 FL=1